MKTASMERIETRTTSEPKTKQWQTISRRGFANRIKINFGSLSFPKNERNPVKFGEKLCFFQVQGLED